MILLLALGLQTAQPQFVSTRWKEREQPMGMREERARCGGKSMSLVYRGYSRTGPKILKLTWAGKQLSRERLAWLNAKEAVERAEFLYFYNCFTIGFDGFEGVQLVARRTISLPENRTQQRDTTVFLTAGGVSDVAPADAKRR
jgi:hypothetical protein